MKSCPRNFYVELTKSVDRASHPECRDSCTGPMASQCTACSGASLRYSNGSQSVYQNEPAVIQTWLHSDQFFQDDLTQEHRGLSKV